MPRQLRWWVCDRSRLVATHGQARRAARTCHALSTGPLPTAKAEHDPSAEARLRFTSRVAPIANLVTTTTASRGLWYLLTGRGGAMRGFDSFLALPRIGSPFCGLAQWPLKAVRAVVRAPRTRLGAGTTTAVPFVLVLSESELRCDAKPSSFAPHLSNA